MSLIIADLDGTLFNIDHRLHFIEEKNWDAFFRAAEDDTPNQWCVNLLLAMQTCGYDIAFVSGRNEIARATTIEQIMQLGLSGHSIYMRPANNRQPDYEFKRVLFDKTPELYEAEIEFVLEDRKQVADMWRSKGLTVLQCDEGEF